MRWVLLTLAAGMLALMACGGSGQTANCKKLLACQAAIGVGADGGSVAKFDNQTYGPNGSCWVSSATSKVCDDACVKELNDMKSLPTFNSVPACTQ